MLVYQKPCGDYSHLDGKGHVQVMPLEISLRYGRKLTATLRKKVKKYLVKVDGIAAALSFASFDHLTAGDRVVCHTYMGNLEGRIIRSWSRNDFEPYYFCKSIEDKTMNKEIQKRLKMNTRYMLVNVTAAKEYKDNIQVNLGGGAVFYDTPQECELRIQELINKNPENKYLMMETYSYVETEPAPVKSTRIKDFE